MHLNLPTLYNKHRPIEVKITLHSLTGYYEVPQGMFEIPYIKRSILDGPPFTRSSILPLQLDRSPAKCRLRTQNKCVAGESCSMCLRPWGTATEADIQANALAIHRRMDKDKAISTCEDCLCSSLSNSVLK